MIKTGDFKDYRLKAIENEPSTTYPITRDDLLYLESCPGCQSSALQVVTRVFVDDLEFYTTVLCERCLYIFRSITPNESWFKKSVTYLPEFTKPNPTLEAIRVRAYEKRKDFVDKRVVDKNVVDVGTGFGAGLGVFAKAGYRIAAIEPDPSRQQILATVPGLELFKGNLEEAINSNWEWKGGLILLCHVFEHFRDPAYILGHLKTLLNSKAIAYVEVPSSSIINWSDAFYLAHMSNYTFSSFNKFVHRMGNGLNVIDASLFIHEESRADIGFVLAEHEVVYTPQGLFAPKCNTVYDLYKKGLPVSTSRKVLKYRIPRIDHFNYGLRFNRYTPKWDGDFITFKED